MKTLILATALAVATFTAPAHGAALRSPKDIPDIIRWADLYGTCVYSTDEARVAKACPAFDALGKTMRAKGYCMVGHATVGRAGKGRLPNGREHCYRIENKQLDKAFEEHQKAIEKTLEQDDQ